MIASPMVAEDDVFDDDRNEIQFSLLGLPVSGAIAQADFLCDGSSLITLKSYSWPVDTGPM